ncbi:MAG: MoaD/ThiS family protein [Pirellulaceae bacterium]|nr:MoaD/ThiS family protein [Pirellulaceae bacterium]
MTFSMEVDVLLFAAAREAAGKNSIRIAVPDSACAQDVLNELAKKIPGIDPLIPSCRLAIDQTYASADAPVHCDCELALIPPVSGG